MTQIAYRTINFQDFPKATAVARRSPETRIREFNRNEHLVLYQGLKYRRMILWQVTSKLRYGRKRRQLIIHQSKQRHQDECSGDSLSLFVSVSSEHHADFAQAKVLRPLSRGSLSLPLSRHKKCWSFLGAIESLIDLAIASAVEALMWS